MSRLILFILTALILSACAVSPKQEDSGPPTIDSDFEGESKPSKKREPIINYDLLLSQLNLNKDSGELGYFEKTFNTCKVGQAYISDESCRQMTLSLVQFRVQCRSTTGTVNSVSNYELSALGSRQFKWTLGLYSGQSRTDHNGFGQAHVVTPGSSKNQPFLLKVGTNNLRLTARNVSRIIVPNDWCD